MGISTTFDATKWRETAMRIVVEWLRDTNCFGSTSNPVCNVVTYTRNDKEEIIIPRCEVAIIGTTNVSTGAGRQGKEAVFRTVMFELTFKKTESRKETPQEAEYDLITKTDLLDKYARSSNGYPKLGAAGLRKGSLEGPISVAHKHFYMQKMLLSVEIEVI